MSQELIKQLRKEIKYLKKSKRHYQKELGKQMAKSLKERMKDADAMIAGIIISQKFKIVAQNKLLKDMANSLNSGKSVIGGQTNSLSADMVNSQIKEVLRDYEEYLEVYEKPYIKGKKK